MTPLNLAGTVGMTNYELVDALRDAHREQGAALREQYPELAEVVGPLFDALCLASEEAW